MVKPFTQNRDISWLRFNERVLNESLDSSIPLLERLKFLAISSKNLDEFFMIRIGSNLDVIKVKKDAIDWRTNLLLLDQVIILYENIEKFIKKRDAAYNALIQDLDQNGIYCLKIENLNETELLQVKKYFKHYILPILSPQIIDEFHPFPHLINKVTYVGMKLKRKNKKVFGIIPMPKELDKYIYLNEEKTRFILLDELLYHFAEDVFKMYQVTEKVLLCVTRNADINFNEELMDDSQDMNVKMKKLLNQRKRLSVVRLELSKNISSTLESYFLQKLSLEKHQVYITTSPLSFDFAFSIINDLKNLNKKFFYSVFQPVLTPKINHAKSIFSQIRRNDLLLYYPFESFNTFLNMIKEAADDKEVMSIKITIYRLSSTAKLIEHLSRASENGKDVFVVMELIARFDEQNNIDWSERLLSAGCRVIFGIDDYKVHSKICLITRREKQGIRYYTQVGTGNYNEKTAKQYTDLTLITANQEIGLDAVAFFNSISLNQLEHDYKHLLVSPTNLKKKIIEFIDEEIKKGNDGYICIKINAITEKDLIHALVKASQSGVKIDLIIRSISCILPNIKGYTENITITSIVGQFLEHARIYSFGKGSDQKVFISSSDLMTRSIERRVELAVPVYQKNNIELINRILKSNIHDNVKGCRLNSSGEHIEFNDKIGIDSQKYFMNYFKKIKKNLKGNIIRHIA